MCSGILHKPPSRMWLPIERLKCNTQQTSGVDQVRFRCIKGKKQPKVLPVDNSRVNCAKEITENLEDLYQGTFVGKQQKVTFALFKCLFCSSKVDGE